MYGNYAPGPQRQRARAHFHGFTVGPLVRAVVMTKTPPGPQRELVPLEFGERLSNYRIQEAVRTHTTSGSKWRPTARQRRRLNHKARAAAVRHYVVDQNAKFAAKMSGERVTNLATGEQHTEPLAAPVSPEQFAPRVGAWDEPARRGVTPPAMMENPPQRGFKLTDRRGEHRS